MKTILITNDDEYFSEGINLTAEIERGILDELVNTFKERL
jgi:broad specificity polyphosphatase/5'/3'-nucleotidase SurE